MKISQAFVARLEDLAPDALVRAIVLLETAPDAGEAGRRARKARRREMAEAARGAVEAAASEVAEILAAHGGRRLERNLDILAALAVETTPAGIRSLAELATVRAIMEDQPISLIGK